MLPVGTFGPQVLSPQRKRPLQVQPLRDEQHIVPQRRSSQKGEARKIPPIMDKPPATRSTDDHGPSSRVPLPKVNSSTSPLKIRKTRENKVMAPRLANTGKFTKTNTHKHVIDQNQTQRVSLKNDTGISTLLLVNNKVESASPIAKTLSSSKAILDFHSKEREDAPQPQQPSTSIVVASNPSQQIHIGPQRRDSIRKRVFTRMLGAIQDKNKGISSIDGVQVSNCSFKRSSNHTENSDGTTPLNPDFVPSPHEFIALNSTENGNDNLESLVTNGTTATPTSFQFPTNFPPSPLQPNLALPTHRSTPLHPKNPREPKAVLNVAVTASPEVESFDLSKAGNMWVAIQIRGEMFIPDGLTTVECDRSISLAVIIDNSYVGYRLGAKTNTNFFVENSHLRHA